RHAMLEMQIDSGRAVPAQREPSEHAMAQAQLNLDRAEFALESAIDHFRRLCGMPDFSAEMIPDEIPAISVTASQAAIPLQMNYVEKGGVEASTQYRNAELNFRQLDLYRRIERTSMRPKLDLLAGVNQDERSYTLDVSRKDKIASIYIGFRVTWNIFDSFASRHRLRARQYQAREAAMQAQAVKEDLIVAAEAAATELEFAERTLKFAERSHRLSLNDVDVTENRIAEGRLAPSDLDAARSAERGARAGVFQARAAYLNASASFLSLVNADPAAREAAEQISNP
ncbi:MAG: TolC family protein, partial [Opitutaceae bacterium]